MDEVCDIEDKTCYTQRKGDYYRGRSLGLRLLANDEVESVWKTCMKKSDANMALFRKIYKKDPTTAAEFGKLIKRPPPGAIKTSLCRYTDNNTDEFFGWAVMYTNSRDSSITIPPTSAIFTAIDVESAAERPVEAIYLIWRYAMSMLQLPVLDTQTRLDSSFGISNFPSFDLVEGVKRDLLLGNDRVSCTYRMTKEKFPNLMLAAQALKGR